MRRALVFTVLTGSAAAAGCSLFVDLDALQGEGGPAVDAAVDDGAADVTVDGASCSADTSSDPHNCGVCGHDCVGGACSAGTCSPFTFAGYQGTVSALACDETAIYWLLVDTSSPAVWRKDLGASGPGVALFDVDDNAFDLAVDSDRAYVTGTPNKLSLVAGDKRTPGASSTLVSVDASDYNPSVAVDGDRIVVGQFPHGGEDGRLAVLARDGGVLGVYSTGGNYTRALGAGDGTVFLTAASGTPNEVRSVSISGGPYASVSDPFGAFAYTNLAVDDAGVAWVTGDNDVGYFDRTVGGKAVDVFDGGFARSVALGGSKVYAAVDPPDSGSEAGAIFAFPRAGGPATAVASGQDHPRHLHGCPAVNVWLAGDDRIVVQAR